MHRTDFFLAPVPSREDPDPAARFCLTASSGPDVLSAGHVRPTRGICPNPEQYLIGEGTSQPEFFHPDGTRLAFRQSGTDIVDGPRKQ